MILPSFQTDRLLVRPRSFSDLDDCLSMDSDQQVTHFVPGPWSDPEKHRAFVVARMKKSYPEGLGYWTAISLDSTQFLGWVLLLPYNDVKGEVEIGWRFTRKSWGHGFATEAAFVVLEHAFLTVNIRSIVADINPLNTVSIRVAEKLDLKYVDDKSIGGDVLRSYQLESTQFL